MRTLVIASVIGLATFGSAHAFAQRIDDRTTALDPESAGVTWGSQRHGGQAPTPATALAGSQTSPAQPLPVPPGETLRAPPPPPAPPPPIRTTSGRDRHGDVRHGGARTGSHWWGARQAPGGWQDYRRPGRGFVLPGYWAAPTFLIGDIAGFGLYPPPRGYRWSRYYDDAVLIDADGRVFDTVSGIDWRDDEDRDGGRDWSVDGGVHDDRYARYGDERWAEHHDRRDGPDGYYSRSAPPSGPVIEFRAGVPGYTQTYVAGGHYAGGYWYPPTTTTTITVASAPVVTTTTTEYIETNRYRASPRKVYRKPKRPVARRPVCNCGS
ncbi:MAG: RcnB family protein [Sphingomonas sp.]|nr:RcnB family protein [Sphingomonas sp.]